MSNIVFSLCCKGVSYFLPLCSAISPFSSATHSFIQQICIGCLPHARHCSRGWSYINEQNK